jgi:hypothetical protein
MWSCCAKPFAQLKLVKVKSRGWNQFCDDWLSALAQINLLPKSAALKI